MYAAGWSILLGVAAIIPTIESSSTNQNVSIIKASPEILNGLPESNATFNCSTKQDLYIEEEDYAWIRLVDWTVIGNQSSLTLLNLNAFHGGQYQCYIGNYSDTVTLYVGPSFLYHPLLWTPEVLDPLSVSCSATGYPAPNSILWFHNGSAIVNSSATLITTETVDTHMTISTLLIESVQPEDAGDYYCIATSPKVVYDNVTSTIFEVYILSVPVQPQNIMATQVHSSYLVLSWSKPFDNYAPIQGYYVLYNQLALNGGEELWQVVLEPAVNLTDLHPGIIYSVVIIAFNDIGNSSESEIITFETLEEAPTDAPAFITTMANSSTEIVVTWNEVPLIHQNGLITTYEVLYESFDDPMSIRMMTVNVTATEYFTLLVDLQEFVSYRIAVRAYTSIGPGPYSDYVLETTLEDRPGSSPSNVTVYLTSSTSIEITWGEVPPIDQNGIVILYEVSCEALETPGRDIDLETLMLLQHTPNNSTHFSPLEGFAIYSIAVRALIAIGAGPYSPPKLITTQEENPDGSPEGVRTGLVTSTSANVIWDKIPDIQQNGIISNYEVTYFPSEDSNVSVDTMSINTSDTHLRVTDLQEFVTYAILIRGYTSVGPGPYSDILLQRTLEDRPAGPPRNVTVVVFSSTAMMVAWNQILPIDQNGIITGYQVLYTPLVTYGGEISAKTANSNVSLSILEDLQEYTMYSINVRARTQVGVGPYSLAILSTTFEDAPDSSPAVTARAMSPTSIAVHWNEVPFIHQNGIITTYEVLYEPLDTYDGQLEGQLLNVTSLSIVLTELEEYTQYNISVRAYTVVGAGPCSDNVIIQTFQDRPASAPENVTATTLSARAIALSWIDIPPIDQNGIIVAYEVLYIPEKNFSGILTWKTINVTDNAAGVIENLAPFVNYTISVRAFTEAGAGVWSEPATATTQEDAPGKPLKVQAKAVYSTEIAVWWQHVPPIHQNGIIIAYEVLYSEESSTISKSILLGLNTSVTLRDLAILTTYSITVRAYTDVGPGPESNPPLNITTQPSRVLIQLRLTGIDDCQLWRMEKSEEKADDIAMSIVETLSQRCHCEFTSDLIGSEGFQCFPESKHAVTFRAEISEAPTTSVSVLVSHLTDWISTGTAISIGALFITVDRTCSIVIASFISEECQADVTTELATRSSEMTDMTVNTVGITTSVVVMASIAAAVVIIVIMITKRKRTKSNQLQCNESEDAEESHEPQPQKFIEDNPSKEDRYVYEPLEDFSKVYEEVNPPSSIPESDVATNTVSKTDEESPSSNHSTANTVSMTDEKVSVPIELLQEDTSPASSNNTVYEEVTPQEILSLISTGMEDQEVGKKMESKATFTTKQVLACNGDGGEEPTTDDDQAYEAATAL